MLLDHFFGDVYYYTTVRRKGIKLIPEYVRPNYYIFQYKDTLDITSIVWL